MPRSKLPSLNSIKDGSFEPNRKNAISLGDDSVLSADSKPIKIGEKSSILELSEDSLIIRGAIEFDTLLRGILNSPNERMAFTAKTGEYRWYSTDNDEDYVRMFVLGGNCLLQAVDASGGTEADINLDAGNDIILDAGSGNITAKDDGGNYTPSSDYHIATKKYVDDNAGGASALNDLSDVTYSSGDLTITSLDKIVTAGALNIRCGGVLTLDSATPRITLAQTGTSFGKFDAGKLYLKEEASAGTDGAAFGQIWIKDDTPNNLYFTDDSGQDIAITNNGVIANQKFFLTSAFFHGNSNAEFIPLAGGSTFEQASLIDFTIDDTNFIVPYDLKINTIYANVVKASSGTANPGNTSLKLYKDGSAYSGAVTVDLSSVGFDTTNIHSVYTWDFSSETNTYSAGEVMQIEIDPTSTLQYVSITIVGQYT